MALTASIFVHDLTSHALYCSQFNVECYSDVGLTTLVATGSSAVTWNGSVWVQSTGIFLTGLTPGSTYYLHWGPVTPVTGVVGWSATYTAVANTVSTPTVSFSATYQAISSGITYVVTPSSPPSDLDHYEAYWNFTNSAPSSSQTPSIKLLDATPTAAFTFFAGATPGTIIYAWVRAVNTGLVGSTWYALAAQTVVNFVGTLDNISDGTTYAKVLKSDITLGHISAIQGNAVKADTLGAGQDGYALTWVNADSKWEAKAVVSSSAWANLTGDLTETQVIPWDGGTPGTPDTGLSRGGAAATVYVGNGGAGDYSGTLKATIINAATGFQVAGAASSGNVLRGNGTNFVSQQLAYSDLSGSPSFTGTTLGPRNGNWYSMRVSSSQTGATPTGIGCAGSSPSGNGSATWVASTSTWPNYITLNASIGSGTQFSWAFTTTTSVTQNSVGAFRCYSTYASFGQTTNMRAWLGVSNSIPSADVILRGTDTPAAALIAFGYSTALSETYFMCVVNSDATHQTRTSSGVAVDTGFHEFIITYDGSNAKFYIDGTLVNTTSNATTGFPTAATLVDGLINLQPTTGATVTLNTSWMYMETV